MYNFDTTLALLSTILVWAAAMPTIYLLSGILVPKLCGIGLDIKPIVVNNVDLEEKQRSLGVRCMKLLSIVAIDLYFFEIVNQYMRRMSEALKSVTGTGSNSYVDKFESNAEFTNPDISPCSQDSENKEPSLSELESEAKEDRTLATGKNPSCNCLSLLYSY